MDRFKNKYRIPSARLQNWDYGSSGLYFITICTKGREHFFGEIKDNEMLCNELGLVVQDEWMKTPGIRLDMNLQLGEFVVMPNHFHGIVMIGDNKYNVNRGYYSDGGGGNGNDVGNIGNNNNDDNNGDDGRDAMHGVSTNPSPIDTNPTAINKFGPQSKKFRFYYSWVQIICYNKCKEIRYYI